MRIDQIHLQNSNPDDAAISFYDLSISYAELENKVQVYSSYLKSQGIEPGMKVALTLPNCPEFIFSHWAVNRLGATAVPLNLFFTLEEIAYVVKNSGADSLIIHPSILEKVDLSGLTGLGLRQIIVLDDNTKREINDSVPFKGAGNFSDDDPAAILYTSGTTGKPKGAVLTHNNFYFDVTALSKVTKIDYRDNFLCVLPMFHSFAWTVCVLLPLYRGGTVVIMQSFQPKETLTTIVEKKVTFLLGVPPMYTLMLKKAEPQYLKSVTLAVSGGAPLSPEIYKAFVDKFSINFVEGYGLTEAAPVVCLNPVEGKKKPGSIGLPLPGMSVIIGDEKGDEVPQGEVGELLVKGGNVMKCYYNDEKATEDTFVGEWLRTGDMARKDEEGYVYIVDRKKDMIIVGGFNVYSREVEDVINEHPKVFESAVVGIEDSMRGEVPKAFIVLQEGEQLSQKDMVDFLKNKLALYKVPRVVEFADELPKNPTGKVLKKKLK